MYLDLLSRNRFQVLVPSLSSNHLSDLDDGYLFLLVPMADLMLYLKNISAHLEELEQLLKGIAMMKELTLRTKDYLVSFGECMSTRIFAAYLNKIGVKARQVCSFLITYFLNCISNLLFLQ